MSERKYREAAMSPVVSDWLTSMGYAVYAEVPFASTASFIDLVGVRWADKSIACVEMKCTFSRKVVSQATLRQLATNQVFVAVPAMPRRSSLVLAAEYGLGVVVNGVVVLEPTDRQRVFNHYTEHILEFCRRNQPGGVGGMPTIAGVGPAISVADAVDAYVAQNPGASWKQIFENVPNHYAHARSMAGALPFARARKRDAVAPQR